MDLTNENFYKRLRENSGIKPKTESKITNSTLINFQRAGDGAAFGIVKENHQYFIKRSIISENELKVSDFTYINGIENKGRYQYNSLGEAEKQRNFLIKNINEAWDLGGSAIQETSKKSPSLNVEDGINSILRTRINESKNQNSVNREKKFKDGLAKNITESNTKSGLLPENANIAIKKALGKLNESDISTADSEIKKSDIISDKSGKEAPQAPINDSNAKAKAEKATATSLKDANKKEGGSNSIAVNQSDEVLKEEDLTTADSEIIDSDKIANKMGGKEAPQAPINDSNAKTEAEKATASSHTDFNGADESQESDPFDDKENAGDEKSDIVSEGVVAESDDQPFDDKPKGESDISTEDSDQADGDRVDNKSSHEKPEAEYNNYSQPEKGHKEEKGEELKPIANEKDIVAEADLTTADSDINTNDSVAEKSGKDSADAPINDTNAKTHADKANGTDNHASQQSESDPFDDKENAGDEKGDIVAEADLSTSDSEIDADSSLANETGANITYEETGLENGTSYSADENAIAKETSGITDKISEDELDAAAAALNDLDIATAEEKAEDEVADAAPAPAPEVPAEPVAAEPAPEAPVDDQPVDSEEVAVDSVEAGDEVAGEDAVTKEIEKLVGKLTHEIRNTDLTPEQTKGHLNSIISSFQSDIAQVEPEERKEISDKILKAQGGSEEGGEEVEASAEVAAEPAPEAPVAEDEEVIDINAEGEPSCDECGTFENYMSSRGYSPDSIGECSISEVANLVSGYANAYGEGMNEGDHASVAKYMNEDVVNEMKEYGHDGYVSELEPFIKKLTESEKISFGVTEPTVTEGKKEDVDGDGDIDSDDYLAKKDAAIDKAMKNEGEETPFAPVAEVMGVSTPSTSVEISEGNNNIRKYIQDRLNEMFNNKKSNINESAKSDQLKNLDELINEQVVLALKSFGDNLDGK